MSVKSAIGMGEQGAILLPDDAVTMGFALLARRRSGKSTLAGVIEETLCDRHDPWVCLDPVSAHWGIRYLDDNGKPGKRSPYEVLIVGGKHGDVPLNEKAGGALAQILVDTDISCVVDLGGESMNARQKFVADFAIELLRINSTPRHVILEEADEFVPQQLVWDNQKYVRGALERLIKQGGGLGIGFSLISQRPASVAKNVLEQIDHLFVLRMKGPNDLKAVQGWFEHNVGDKAEMNRILASVAAFQQGEAWLCSSEGDVERFKVRQRVTYHAGRTPKRGEKPVAPKRFELGKVVEQYTAAATKRQIAVQVERDLKSENVELKRQLKTAGKAQPAKACDHEKDLKRLRGEAEANELNMRLLAAHNERETAFRLSVEHAMHEWNAKVSGVKLPPLPKRPAVAPSTPVVRRAEQTAPTKRTEQTTRAEPAEGLTGPEQRVLNALAWWEAIGVDAPTKGNVGFVAGYRVGKRVGGNYGNLLGQLRAKGLIDYPTPNAAALTDVGRASAQGPDDMPSLDELHAAVYAKLKGPERRVLEVLVKSYPDSLTKQDVGANAGYQVGDRVGGNFGNLLGQLRSLGLIDYPSPGSAIATALLFPEGLA